MIRPVLALAAAGALLAACGSDAGRFDEQASAVREAVEAGDRAGALAALEEVALEGLDAHAAGDLSDAELDELAALVEQGRALVDQQVPEPTTTTEATTTTTTTTTSPPPPAVFDDDRDDDDDDDDDEGRGKGNKKKDDD